MLDKTLDLTEVLKIMGYNDSDSGYMWSSDTFSYDGIITYTDLIEMIIFVYNTMTLQRGGNCIEVAGMESFFFKKMGFRFLGENKYVLEYKGYLRKREY